MDAATYVPTQGNMITLTDPNAYFNDIPVNFGPKFWDVLNAMANKVGEMQYIIGLSMEDPSAVSNVVEIAAAAEQQLGSRLDAMLLGNVGLRIFGFFHLISFSVPRNLTCTRVMEQGQTTLYKIMYVRLLVRLFGCLP